MTKAFASLERSYWLATGLILYACLGAAASGGGVLPWLAIVTLPLLLAEVYRRTRAGSGDDRMPGEARSAVRASFWGAALLLAARTGTAARPALDAAANLGAGASAVGALVALARLPAMGGVLDAPRGARSLDAALFVGFLWGIATAVPSALAILPAPSVRLDPLVVDYATTSAGIGTLLVMTAATLRLRVLRRLELGVSDRARSAFALSIAAFGVAVPAAWLDVAPPDRVLPAAVAVASVGSAWAAATAEATRVTQLLRGVLAVMIVGAPLLVAATVLAQAAPAYAPALVLTTGVAAICVGLLAHAVSRPLGPEHSRWLVALDQAARDALQPEPNAALRAALIALGHAAPARGGRPEIWQRDPPEVLSVDVAGFLHETRAEAPERLYEIGLGEPERTIRTDVLRALEVRRADVRPLLAWLEAREAFSATLVVDEDGPIGFILLPRGTRTTPLTLEEARAARLLADRISSLLAVAAALGRSRERELAAVRRADAADDECRRLEHIVTADAERHQGLAARLARPVRRAAYSASARLALDNVASLAKKSPLLALVVPPGTDAAPWAAHAHLASPRSGGPFVIIDGANAEEQKPEQYTDELRSPLRFADGGSLLVLAPTALPPPTQETLALALARRAAHAPHSSILPPGVIVTLPARLEELTRSGRLSATLARWFEDTEILLPRLAERADDLFALGLDTLARRCLELGKPPIGIDPSALRLLLEHTWPGNDIELAGVLGRVAAIATGPSVTAEDLERVGFAPVAAPPADVSPLPAPARRRPSRRPLRG
jgi:hypothetical protein